VTTITVVIMGVAGTGKTTVMRALADRLGWPTAESDDFHPPSNVAKMAAGHPLDDSDRWPWLASIAAWIGEREEAGECAMLRRDHPSVRFVHLVAAPAVLAERMAHRSGHYMPVSLLSSQLETLEGLQPNEPGIVVQADRPVAELVDEIIGAIIDRT
jgi:gluconokinase